MFRKKKLETKGYILCQISTFRKLIAEAVDLHRFGKYTCVRQYILKLIKTSGKAIHSSSMAVLIFLWQ